LKTAKDNRLGEPRAAEERENMARRARSGRQREERLGELTVAEVRMARRAKSGKERIGWHW
jgi:hypothetical protein